MKLVNITYDKWKYIFFSTTFVTILNGLCIPGHKVNLNRCQKVKYRIDWQSANFAEKGKYFRFGREPLLYIPFFFFNHSWAQGNQINVLTPDIVHIFWIWLEIRNTKIKKHSCLHCKSVSKGYDSGEVKTSWSLHITIKNFSQKSKMIQFPNKLPHWLILNFSYPLGMNLGDISGNEMIQRITLGFF